MLVRSCEHRKGTKDSIKGTEFLVQLFDRWLLRKGSDPRSWKGLHRIRENMTSCTGRLHKLLEFNVFYGVMKGKIIIVVASVDSTALGGPWPLKQMSPANFYNPVSLCLPPPRQSILISVGHVVGDLQGLSVISF